MSTVPATDKAFGFACHTAPDTTKEAAASVHVTEGEQDVRTRGKKKSPVGRKCHVCKLVL